MLFGCKEEENMKKKAFILFILILLIFSALTVKAADLVVYAALDQKTPRDIIKVFEEQTSLDVELALQIEQAGTVASRIKTEAKSPRADVFIGGNSNIHASLAIEGFLQEYRSPMVEEAGIDRKFMDPHGYWSGWYLGAMCIHYNTKRFNEEIAPRGIKPPSSWDDLLNPVYKGEVITSNPATTGSAVIIMATQIFRLGSVDAGFKYVADLNKNVRLYTRGSNGSIDLVSRGEAIVGTAWGHDTIARKTRENLPITIVFPKDDGYEIGAASIIKGCKNLAAAEKFIDFLLTPTPAEINAKIGLRYPVRKGVALPAGVPPFESLSFVNYDHEMVAKNVEAWKQRWSEITGH
jgi:iron(III) transport system substrate-binding protein